MADVDYQGIQRTKNLEDFVVTVPEDISCETRAMSNTLGGVVISQAPRDMGCNEILQRISSESDDSSNRCRHPMQRSLTNSSIGSFDALDENDLEGIGVSPSILSLHHRKAITEYLNQDNKEGSSSCGDSVFMQTIRLLSRENSSEDYILLLCNESSGQHAPRELVSSPSSSSSVLSSITESVSHVSLTSSSDSGYCPSKPVSEASSPCNSVKMCSETSLNNVHAVEGSISPGSLGNVDEGASCDVDRFRGSIVLRDQDISASKDVILREKNDMAKKDMSDQEGVGNGDEETNKTGAWSRNVEPVGPRSRDRILTDQAVTSSLMEQCSDEPVDKIRDNDSAAADFNQEDISSDTIEKDSVTVGYKTITQHQKLKPSRTEAVLKVDSVTQSHVTQSCVVTVSPAGTGRRNRHKSEPEIKPPTYMKMKRGCKIIRAFSEPTQSDVINLDLLKEIEPIECYLSGADDSLTKSDISTPLKEQSIRQCVKDRCEDFVNYSDWNLLLPHLQSKDLLDRHTTEKLLNKYTTSRDKGLEFYLSVLPTKGNTAYSRLYDCIAQENEHSGHTTLLELMNNQFL